jgi:acyl-CoA hydrolase
LGDIVEARARVVFTGRTSMIVRIEIWGERPLVGWRALCTTGYYSFVSVDEHGRPAPVPMLAVQTPEQQADWRRAEEIHNRIRARRSSDS